MSSTDVREWLRDQGHDVKDRGKVPDRLQAEYDAAHPRVTRESAGHAEILESDYPDLGAPDAGADDIAAGVTVADFPEGGADVADAGPAASTGRSTSRRRGGGARRERAPRVVKPNRPKRFTERIFGARTGSPRPRSRAPRVNLGEFAEETWADLAWLAQPVPPLAEMLTIQAPYAGVVFDQQVKGTFVDTWLQPIARHAGVFRSLNGLVGPPVYVALICAIGKRIQATDPETGKPATYPDGSPVMVNDARTAMAFAGLRYSLLQMVKISDQNVEEISERAQAAAERNRMVDALIARIFAMPSMPQGMAPQPPPPAPSTPTDAGGGFTYPAPPEMDGVGVDPGRM